MLNDGVRAYSEGGPGEAAEGAAEGVGAIADGREAGPAGPGEVRSAVSCDPGV